MFEKRHENLISRAAFASRMFRSAALALGLVAVSLGGGATGYHCLEGQPWVDAVVNASMLLGGMGPVDPLHSTAGKLFASLYALYSGLVFLIVAGVVFAPVFHRFLHRFHLDMEGGADEGRDEA